MQQLFRVAAQAVVVAVALCCAAQAAEPRFEPAFSFGTEGVGEGQFKYVEDFALTSDGHLLVTDAAHAYVQVFDKTTGKFITRFGGKGDEDHHLEKPEGVAVDPTGNIFIADYTTGYIKKYDKNYKWMKTFSEYGEGPGQNIKSEFMSIHDGKLYMPEAGNHRVDVFDLEGKFLFLFGGLGSEPGKMNVPEAAKFGPNGLLYVADLKNDRIQVFDKDGKFQKSWGKTGSEPGEFKAPAGVGIDKDGHVYVAEIGNDRVQMFSADGAYLTHWGKKGAGVGEFGNLHGLMVDPATGWVYVADTANHRVQVFKPKL